MGDYSPSDKRSPAFRFYARDFLADTSHMTDAEAGMYVRLLCREWMDGNIPASFDAEDEPSIMSSLPGGTPKKEREKAWRTVGRCFSPDPSEPGRLIQTRLEREREKQVENRERRVEAGKKGAEGRWGDGQRKKSKKKANGKGKPNAEQSHGNRTASAQQSDANDVRSDGLAFALALASAETEPSGSSASAREDLPQGIEPTPPLDDRAPLDDDPSLSATVPTSPAFRLASWFLTEGVAAKAIPPHYAFEPTRFVFRQQSAAETLLAAYPLDEIKARSAQFFARKTTTGPRRVNVSCSLVELADKWDWFEPERAPEQAMDHGWVDGKRVSKPKGKFMRGFTTIPPEAESA